VASNDSQLTKFSFSCRVNSGKIEAPTQAVNGANSTENSLTTSRQGKPNGGQFLMDGQHIFNTKHRQRPSKYVRTDMTYL
jgi:hypothetical protein